MCRFGFEGAEGTRLRLLQGRGLNVPILEIVRGRLDVRLVSGNRFIRIQPGVLIAGFSA